MKFKKYFRPHLWVKLLILSSAPLIYSSCQTQNARNPQFIPPKDGYEPAPWTQLTSRDFDNSFPQFSPDGKSIVFTKRVHKEEFPQAYLLNVADKKETRLTFQKSPIYFPRFAQNNTAILFGSSVDEWIENPPILKKNSSVSEFFMGETPLFPAIDIYSLSFKGSRLKRLTEAPGFDSPLEFQPKTRFALLSRYSRNWLQIYRIDIRNKKLKRMTKTPSHKFNINLSPDGKSLVWVEIQKDGINKKEKRFSQSQLVMAPTKTLWKPKSIDLPKGLHSFPQWSQSGQWILFSSNLETPDQQELFVIKPDGSCLQRITYSKSNEQWAQFSPKDNHIVFTSDQSGQNQVYLMDFKPRPTCAPAKAALDS